MLKLNLIAIFCFLTLSNAYFAPNIFLNHGGGPYPVLREEHNIEIADSLKNISKIMDLEKLSAIVIVTAHREEDVVTITSSRQQSLVYDYYHFPPVSYTFKYNAPGDPELARRIHNAFEAAGIKSQLDDQRGWDHGVFIPMMLINPKADIPVIQVSILKNQDAKQHYDIGKALFQFRKEGVAIFGSGMSYHNMAEFDKVERNLKNVEVNIVNHDFDNFLNDVCTGEVENRQKILLWEQQRGGYESHPLGEADHLMPLIVNAGAAGTRPGRKYFESIFLYKFLLSGFIWDDDE
ncbi:extradiol ring-cleavage dioxygenase-like [Trichoplusia ni]|uniref:Extradiol ring-cleavage dioxygenase-like n=1 Tax=Trichoplusia ni TaxID=7111 RepID=A0A7E5VB54_TRINI|nr:extradiol ring-cleavage dioxygenase-like [Trichoplusia ni]